MNAENIIFLGDVHCNLNHCIKLSKKNPQKTILQIGDLGVGFIPTEIWTSKLPDNFKFFVGNHDNRQESYKIPNCLGDFGEYNGVFFVSGADSIDRNRRTIGVDWWEDEELSYKQFNEVLSLWEKSNCEIIATHDCPQSFAEAFFLIYDQSKTRVGLDNLLKIKKPKVWIFGHHHKPINVEFNGIKFHGLGIDKTLTVKT